MKALLVLALFALVCLASAQQGTNNCQGNAGGDFYNLWDLHQKLGGSVQSTISSGQTYYYVPCGTVQGQITDCNFPSYDTTPAVCQRDARNPPQYHGCGTGNPSSGSPTWQPLDSSYGSTKGFRLFFNKGGEPDGTEPRSTTIDFVCEPSNDPGQLSAKIPDESPEHAYHLEWRTKYACPGAPPPPGPGGDGEKGGISVGWILVIIFFGILILYFLIGACVNKFYFKSEGVEIIPNHGFWFALPGLVKDGNVFVVRKALGLCGRGGGYSAV